MKSQVMFSRAKVKQIEEFYSLVKKAKQHAEVALTFVPISLDEEFTIVAIGDSAFETVVDQKTAAGYVVGLMATEDIRKRRRIIQYLRLSFTFGEAVSEEHAGGRNDGNG